MKKLISLILVTTLLSALLFGCSSESAASDAVSTSQNTTGVTVPVATQPVTIELVSSGTLGEFDVQINDFELCRDYSGSLAILISYTFTNNSEEATSAMMELLDRAYQNGVQLDSAIISDDQLYNSADVMKDIKPGVSIDLKTAFLLTSETAPVEFEIMEAFTFTEEKLGKTFQISDNGVTELCVAPGTEDAEALGNYAVSVNSYKIIKDYEGNNAILFELGFTNNDTNTASFLDSIDFTAFQDGIELEVAFITDSSVETGTSQMRNIKPGAGTSVFVAFVLSSDSSPVEIEIKEYWGSSNSKIETVIDIV